MSATGKTGREDFHLEEREGLGILHMHAGSANALNERVIDAILEGLRQADAAGHKGLILTGYDRFFCAGLDLIEVYEYERERMANFIAAFDEKFEHIFSFPKPIVAAINGAATAGGAILALACDYRLLAEEAKIGLSEIQLGLPLPASAFEVARHAIPAASHPQAFYAGKVFEAQEALRLGLVHEIAPRAHLLEVALERLQAFAVHPGEACGVLKAALRAPALARMRKNAEAMREEFLQAWFSPSARQTIGAIREKLKAKKASV